MELIIKKTETPEYFATENLTREAFWNMYKPGCDEHFCLHLLRKSNSYIRELDLIAVLEEEIVGHIISTKARVIDEQSIEHEVLCVGPISVMPSLQNQGIGTKLINHSISIAQEMGFKGMILFGNPDYYSRFGFTNAQKYKITTKDNHNFDPFMALELTENGLDDIKGRFFEDEVFFVKEEELIEFEQKFSAKEKGKPKIDLSALDYNF